MLENEALFPALACFCPLCPASFHGMRHVKKMNACWCAGVSALGAPWGQQHLLGPCLPMPQCQRKAEGATLGKLSTHSYAAGPGTGEMR